MNCRPLTVVLSQAHDRNPAKKALEEALVAALRSEIGLEVAILPHLTHLSPEHAGHRWLQALEGNLVVLSWLYPRAAFWVLYSLGVKGHLGTSAESASEVPDAPDRLIHCLDLRDSPHYEPFVDQVKRMAVAQSQQSPGRVQPSLPQGRGEPGRPSALPVLTPAQLLESTARRWFPVIDYCRCTHCMECLDFCLFGVYGVDRFDRIVVETPDSCKKGCPACSRVCPEHAIMFPDHKTPAIAGAANVSLGDRKIDLTQLFGGADLRELAAEERNRELSKDGRQAVGKEGTTRRQAHREQPPKDELDRLMDDFDALDI
jgi:Pyruvate/2-oxoacid:ferredoxin oxidoreductase delta subunit